MCNHLLGHLKDYDYIPLRSNTIKDDLKYYSDSTLSLSKDGYGKFVEPKHYLDGRYNLSTMFSYCPYCGEKINWKKIKQEVKS